MWLPRREYRAALVWQLGLAGYMQLISWVPLGRWNYQPCCPPGLERLSAGTLSWTNVVGTVAFLLPVALFWLAARWEWRWAMWLVLAATSVWLGLQLWTWWPPYLFGASDHWSQVYARAFAHSTPILPRWDNHLPPDAMHLVLQVLLSGSVATGTMAVLQPRHPVKPTRNRTSSFPVEGSVLRRPPPRESGGPLNEVSIFRLYVLRATYLLIVVGVGAMIWPLLLDAPETAEHFRGVTWCLLSTVALLALLGLRYPLKVLPLLLFDLVWKTTWLVTIGLPLRSSGRLEGAFRETWFANVMGLVIFSLAIPWGNVIRQYIREPGDRWTWSKTSTAEFHPERS